MNNTMKNFGINETAIKKGDETFTSLTTKYKLTKEEKKEIDEHAREMFNSDLSEGTAYVGNLTDLINHNRLWAAIAHISNKYNLEPNKFKTMTRNEEISVYYQDKQIV